MIPLAFMGDSRFGAVKFRGVTVAARMGVPFFDSSSAPQPVRVLIVVKHWPENIADWRSRCQMLVLDPLDSFWRTPGAEPLAYWERAAAETAADVMLATSPACADLMPGRVVFAPCHADPRIVGFHRNPNGPVVYAGQRQFLDGEAEQIAAACRSLNRRFLVTSDFRSLNGAALALAVRCGRTRTPLNLACKPAVKVANAAAAGVPVLAKDDAAVVSLETRAVIERDGWAADIERAIAADPAEYPWSLDTHCETLHRLVT